MLGAAAFVDVAIAESRDLIDIEARLTEIWKPELEAARDDADRAESLEQMELARRDMKDSGLARVRFKTVERLKGESPGQFELTAFSFDQPPSEGDFSAEGAARRRGDYSDPKRVYYAPSWVQADVWGGGGSCDTALTVVIGQRYLIFRGADGRLLGEQEANSGLRVNWQQGSVFEPVTENDPWLARVRKAAARAR